MFTEALFTITRILNACPPIGDRIKKMCYIYTIEYDSALERMKSYNVPVVRMGNAVQKQDKRRV